MYKRRAISRYICFIFLLSFFFFLLPANIKAAVIIDNDNFLQDIATDSMRVGNAFIEPMYTIPSTDGSYIVNYVGSSYSAFLLTYERAAVKLDLSDITGTIQSASLELYIVEVNGNPVVNVIPTSDSTWNEYDTSTSFPAFDPEEAIYSNFPITAAHVNSPISFDVTSDIQARVDNGDDKAVYVLTGREGTFDDDFAFVCNQHPDASKWAKLVIEYVPAAAAPIVTGTAYINDTTPTWNWSSGGNGNGIFRYRLDNSDLSIGAIETVDTSYTSEIPLMDGSHTLYVQESNGAGHWSPSGTYTITVDTISPNAPLGSASILTNDPTPTWNWTSGGGGNGNYRYKLDNSDLSAGASLTTSTSFTPVSPLADGSHILYVQERDDAGNWSSSRSYEIVIDTTPPNMPIVTGTTPVTTGTPTWTWSSGGEGIGDYRYKLDDNDLSTFSTLTSGNSYTPGSSLPDGEHVLYVQEKDEAGNWSLSGSFSITIDTMKPNVEIDTPGLLEPRIAKESPIPVTITFNEPVTGFTGSDILINNGTILAGSFSGSDSTYTVNITPSGQGVVTIDVPAGVAQDAAGNSNNAAAQITINYDNVPPTDGTISINGGAPNTTDTLVTLTLSATDAVQMIISEDVTFTDASYQPYATSVNFELSNGDGEKTVYVKFKDAAGNETEAISSTIILDATIPIVFFSSSEQNPTSKSPFSVAIIFSENVTGFTENDIVVGNGTISSLLGFGSVYTVNVTPAADGDVTLDMANGAVQDIVGNDNMAPLQFRITYDSLPPTGGTVSINGGATYANSSTATLTLSATDADYMIISENSDFSGASYEAYATNKSLELSAGSGNKTVYVKFKDEAGNQSEVISDSIILDMDRPTIEIVTTGPNPTNSNSIPITITFSEPVTDFSISKIVTTGDISDFSGDGTVYTFILSPNIAGIVDITFTITIVADTVHDQVGNGNSLTEYSINYDTEAPTLGIVQINSGDSYTNSREVILSFFASGATVMMISEDENFDGASYEAYHTNKNFTLSSGDGNKRVYVKYKDATGNETTYDIHDDIILETSQPSVTILLDGTFEGKESTNESSIDFRIEFSETVSGFDLNDITIVNGSVSSWFGDGQVYSVSILPLAQGTVTVSMDSGRVQDAAGNNNTAAQPISINYDSIRPSVTVFGTSPNPTGDTPIQININFTEPVTGFTAGDITVTNGTMSNFSGSGANFTVDVTPATDGEVSVAIPEGMVTDSTGNTNTGSNLWVTTYVAPLTVTYNYNYDSEGVYTTLANVPYGSAITKPLTNPTRTGYRFEGWYKEAECINPWNFASDKVTSDSNIYANWVAKNQVSITEDIQEYLYDGVKKSFVISGMPDDNFIITYNQGSSNVDPVSPGSYNVVISRAEDDTYVAYNKSITGGLVIIPSPITIAAITGVEVPRIGRTPVIAITETAQYTGMVTWSPVVTSFASNTVYTATITLTPKTGYTLSGITENFFTVAGATTTNEANSGIVTAVFPNTGTSQSEGGGGGAGTASTTPNTPTYNANVKTDSGQTSLLPASVDNKTGRVSVNIDTSNSLLSNGESVTINMPSISGVNSYTLGIPVPSLSTSKRQRSIILHSDAGSINIPSNMLAGIKNLSNSAGTKGTKAEITISQSDKTNLPKKVKDAIGDKPVIQLSLSIDGKLVEWNNPNAPIAVSIPYKPSGEELANYENIVVWYIDSNNKVVAVPNGRYDPATGTVKFFVTHFSDYAVAYVDKNFNDLNDVKWVEKAIDVLVAKGIMDETGDGTFSPAKKITRADYIVWLVRTLNLTATLDDNFDDVKPNASYYEAVGIARKLNIILDDGDNLFHPKDKISRQDMMVLTTRALMISQGLKITKDNTVLDKFKDKEDIADYARSSLASLVKNGLTVSSSNKLKPNENATRAEAAALLYSIYNKYTNVPTAAVDDTAVEAPYPITAPGNLKAVSTGKNSVKLTWDTVAGATKYVIYQATSKNGTYKKLAETTSTSYTSKKLTTNKKYYYKVRAYRLIDKKKVYGDYSSVVSAKPTQP